MKLTEDQKEQVAEVIEELDTHPMWVSSEKAVFNFDENGRNWQLQVKVVQDAREFI